MSTLSQNTSKTICFTLLFMHIYCYEHHKTEKRDLFFGSPCIITMKIRSSSKRLQKQPGEHRTSVLSQHNSAWFV